jgi:hypothetical protein
MLETITAHQPFNWRMANAWTAYQGTKTSTRRTQGADIEPDSPRVLYNIGTAYHEAGRHRIRWLGRAKATRKLDMMQIESDPNLSALKVPSSTHCSRLPQISRSRSSRR